MRSTDATTLIAALFVIGVSASQREEWRKDVQGWFNGCLQKLDITADKLDEIQSTGLPPVERLATCFTACLFEKSGLMKSGRVEKSEMYVAMRKLLGDSIGEDSDDELRDTLEKCYDLAEKETDECNVAGVFSECLHKERPDIGTNDR